MNKRASEQLLGGVGEARAVDFGQAHRAEVKAVCFAIVMPSLSAAHWQRIVRMW